MVFWTPPIKIYPPVVSTNISFPALILLSNMMLPSVLSRILAFTSPPALISPLTVISPFFAANSVSSSESSVPLIQILPMLPSGSPCTAVNRIVPDSFGPPSIREPDFTSAPFLTTISPSTAIPVMSITAVISLFSLTDPPVAVTSITPPALAVPSKVMSPFLDLARMDPPATTVIS